MTKMAPKLHFFNPFFPSLLYDTKNKFIKIIGRLSISKSFPPNRTYTYIVKISHQAK